MLLLYRYESQQCLEPKHFEKFVLSVFDKFCSYRTEYSIFNVDIKKAIISFDEDGTVCFKTKIDVSKQALNALFGLFGLYRQAPSNLCGNLPFFFSLCSSSELYLFFIQEVTLCFSFA
jgi:hypothetical protein